MTLRPAPWVAFLMVSLALAGCTAGDAGQPFEVLLAPEWEAGYEWRYDTVETGTAVIDSRGNEYSFPINEFGKTVQTVFNTTKPVNGEPAYHVHSTARSADVGFADFSEPYTAMSKADLAVLAVSGAHPGFEGIYESQSDERGCVDTPVLETVGPQERFDVLRFPLSHDDTWAGQFMYNDEEGLGYRVEARGLRPVEVPAGSFQAAYLRATFSPIGEYLDGELRLSDYRSTLEVWYSPEARNIVKSVATVHLEGYAMSQGAEVRLDAVATESLASYSLNARPELPAPMLESEPSLKPHWSGIEIVADNATMHNLADGPANVTLTIRERVDDPFSREPTPEEPVARVESLPEPFWDPQQYELRWRVFDRFGQLAESRDDALVVPLDRGGRWTVEADLTSRSCFEHYLWRDSADVSTYQEIYFFSGANALEGSWQLAEFEVDTFAQSLLIQFQQSGVVENPGQVRLDGPVGSRVVSSGEVVPYLTNGHYELSWEPDFVSIGESFSGYLRLDY